MDNQINDYFEFVESEVKKIKTKLESHCLGFNTSIKKLAKTSMFAFINLSNSKKPFKNKDITRSMQLGFTCALYLGLQEPIISRNLNITFTQYANLFANLRALEENMAVSEMKSTWGRKGQEDNRELKEQAVKYWREHIDPKLSNQKAADTLIKIVALSHRKLAEYVAEAKRDSILSAS